MASKLIKITDNLRHELYLHLWQLIVAGMLNVSFQFQMHLVSESFASVVSCIFWFKSSCIKSCNNDLYLHLHQYLLPHLIYHILYLVSTFLINISPYFPLLLCSSVLQPRAEECFAINARPPCIPADRIRRACPHWTIPLPQRIHVSSKLVLKSLYSDCQKCNAGSSTNRI